MRSLALVALGLALPTAPANAQFVTAEQVRPILEATKGNWIAVRLYDGKDLLYFSHLEAWRCGLAGVRYGLNGAPPAIDYALAPCDETAANPNAIPNDHLPYVEGLPYSIASVTVELTYDDGTVVTETFERAAVQID